MASRRPTRLHVVPLEDRAVPAALIVDPTFGVNGFVTLADAQVHFIGAIATPDGGTLFVSTGAGATASDTNLLLLKFTATGAVDTGFGTAGRVTLDSGVATLEGTLNGESLTGLLVLPDGRITVTGRVTATTPFGAENEWAIAYRLSAAGVLDATYDGDGKLLLGPASTTTGGGPVVKVATPNLRLLPDGGLVGVYGSEVFAPGSPQTQFPIPPGVEELYLEALRVTPGGAFDPTFGGGGKAKILLGTSESRYGSGSVAAGQAGVFVRPDGSIVFTLAVTTATVDPADPFRDLRALRISVAQLTPAGAFDAAFGTDGRALVKAVRENGFGSVTLAGLQPGGGALTRLDGSSDEDPSLFRLTASGAADPSFGFGGTLTNSFTEVKIGADGGFEADPASGAVGYTADGKPLPVDPGARYESPPRLPSGNAGTLLEAAGGATFLVGGTPRGPLPGLPGQTFLGRLVVDPNPPVFGPAGRLAPRAVGDAGVVTLTRADGSVVVVTPFPGFAGEVRTATAGGVVFLATGPGVASRVAAMDAATGKMLRSFEAFEASFTAGVYLAAADVDGDGVADVVVTPAGGGGPRVRVLNGATGAPLADFFGIEDGSFRGGARAAFGDVNGDGTPDLAVVAAVGGGPRVAVYDGKTLLAGKLTPLAADFFAFDSGLRSGLTVAAGDFDGDGFADLSVTPGVGGGPAVAVFSGKELTANRPTRLANFAQGDIADRNGARSSVRDINGDGEADLVVAGGGRVRGYLGSSLVPGNPVLAFDLDPAAAAAAGVLVG